MEVKLHKTESTIFVVCSNSVLLAAFMDQEEADRYANYLRSCEHVIAVEPLPVLKEK